MRVLVIENDAAAAETLVRGLRRHGNDATSVGTGASALKTHRQAEFVLLDLELPDIDGLQVCRTIRDSTDTPIIAVTARGTELDRVLGLQAGADDYLVKPYGFRELLARMDAVMRRASPGTPVAQEVSHGPLHIDAGAREVRLEKELVKVTRKEFDLLHMLVSRPDHVVSRQQLMSQVWEETWTKSGRTIDTHVSSLRSKLGASTWITTVRGVGFRIGHG
ncbi:response regulator transcription factor [Streptomyces camponoticapitis]|uniref:response regulator transcription factor n=1 Tax=Streptomyces camponoticapitis TaxID=1616125 RepID=UPI001E5FFDCD|nr:response regulator transcription factor [Streptomyces camponoticapitis]